eukprot:m.239024 g.239024  ORF g.239024 m.239024 type:complete len:95 (-) comp19404_c0_seq7:2486-2770(-)
MHRQISCVLCFESSVTGILAVSSAPFLIQPSCCFSCGGTGWTVRCAEALEAAEDLIEDLEHDSDSVRAWWWSTNPATLLHTAATACRQAPRSSA